MRHQLKFLFIAISLLLLTAFVLFVFNQVMQVYTYTSTINPLFGKAVLATLTLLFVALFILPVLLYLRLPKPITPPATVDESP